MNPGKWAPQGCGVLCRDLCSPCGEKVETVDQARLNHKEWDVDSSQKEERQTGKRAVVGQPSSQSCGVRDRRTLTVLRSRDAGTQAREDAAEERALSRRSGEAHLPQTSWRKKGCSLWHQEGLGMMTALCKSWRPAYPVSL